MTSKRRITSRAFYLLATTATMAVATGAHAQAAKPSSSATAPCDASTGQQAGSSGPTVTPCTKSNDIVVVGQREALKSAISIKEHAQTIVDSISADDAGHLPDNSVTEVLQRVPGVTITRIQTGNVGSENFLAEGTGLQIRGLDSVSLLNGRDSFSSVNGRNLAFEDVPPELMQGVDVYKAAEADIPEGGFGGVINLRTRQPFDFPGLKVEGSLDGNYADYSNKGHVGGNLMLSDHWHTGIGQFGLLADVAYSDLATRADGVQVQPYFPQVYDPTLPSAALSVPGGTRLPNLSDPGAEEVYVPYGVDFSSSNSDRKRLGIYASGQWKPNDSLTITGTMFRSQYKLYQFQHYLMVDDSSDTVVPPGDTATFDSNGLLTSTTGLAGYSYVQPNSATGASGGGSSGWSYVNNPYDFQTSESNGTNKTTDYSLVGEWNPNSKLNVKLALQHVDSSAVETDNYGYLYAFIPQYGLSLSSYGSSDLPVLSLPSSIDLSNPANYGFLATMDHLTNNVGRENAAYLDTTYFVSDSALLRILKFGLKFTRRTEDDQQTPYNYQGLSPYYDSSSPTTNCPSGYCYLPAFPQYGEQINLGSWFSGNMGLPSSAYFPSATELNTNFATVHENVGTGANQAQDPVPVSFVPADTSTLKETTITGYAMAGFRSDGGFLPFQGNLGVRVVASRDRAAGNLLVAGTTGEYFTPVTYPAPNYQPSAVSFASTQSAFPSKGGSSLIYALPSFNIQFLPTPQTHIRFAASEGLNRPSFQELNPQATLGSTYVGTYNQDFITSVAGNPNLKPETSLQLDTSLEYYFKHDGQIHFAAFYKNIKNFIGTEAGNANFTLPTTIATPATQINSSLTSLTPCPDYTYQASCPQTINAVTQSYFNESANATVAGFEVGLQKYASFLPGVFSGLGIDANYTYISSHQPGARAFDVLGNQINGLPVTGLSKNTYNVQLLYDRGPISLRLAYNYRSSFLITTTAYQTSGAYDNLTNVPDTTDSGSVNTYGVPTYYALPVFQYGSGQLDANFTYKLNNKINFVLEASNLTDTVTRLYIGSGADRTNRSWYVADRRYRVSVQFSF